MADDQQQVGGAILTVAGHFKDDRCVRFYLGGHLDQGRAVRGAGHGPSGDHVDGRVEGELAGLLRTDQSLRHPLVLTDPPGDLVRRRLAHHDLEPVDRGESPGLLPAGGHGVVGEEPRRGWVQV